MNKDNTSAVNNRSNSNDAFDLSLSAPAGLDGSTQNDNIPTELMNIHAMLPQKEIRLPPGYQPRNSVDILCGRGKQYWKENVHFRHFIKQSVPLYQKAKSKSRKTALVISLVKQIRDKGGHFLKKVEDKEKGGEVWVDIGDILARDKVSHSIRDSINHSERRKAKMVEKHKRTQAQQAQKRKHQRHSAPPRLQEILSSEMDNISLRQSAVLPRFSEEYSQDSALIRALRPATSRRAPVPSMPTSNVPMIEGVDLGSMIQGNTYSRGSFTAPAPLSAPIMPPHPTSRNFQDMNSATGLMIDSQASARSFDDADWSGRKRSPVFFPTDELDEAVPFEL